MVSKQVARDVLEQVSHRLLMVGRPQDDAALTAHERLDHGLMSLRQDWEALGILNEAACVDLHGVQLLAPVAHVLIIGR